MTVSSVMQHQTLLLASFAVGVLLVGLVFYLFQRKSASRGSSVLLLGISDAGKTAILTTLAYDQTLPTHASLQTNVSVVSLSPTAKQPLKLVDIPGHPRLRGDFKQYVSDAKAIAFVVDASTVARNGASVAEHLHNVLNVLASIPPTRTPPALLILAHKTDLLSVPSSTPAASIAATRESLAVTRVRTILERELEKRRVSNAGDVGIEGLGSDTKEAAEEDFALGGLDCRGSTFKFSELISGDVSFIGTYVKVGVVHHDPEEKVDVPSGVDVFRDWLLDLD